MSGDQAVRPRHVVCVLGKGLDFATVERVIADIGGDGYALDHEYSQHSLYDEVASRY